MKENNLAHNVFFTLKDSSEASVEKLVEECYTYLKDAPGVIAFYAGPIVAENKRGVNITDFQVGLHLVFSNIEYHDQYQVSEKHNVFIDRNKDNWAKVRVFDTYVK